MKRGNRPQDYDTPSTVSDQQPQPSAEEVVPNFDRQFAKAHQKFKATQEKHSKISHVANVLKGQEKEMLIPKPGEFFMMSSTLDQQEQQTSSAQRMYLRNAPQHPMNTMEQPESNSLRQKSEKMVSDQRAISSRGAVTTTSLQDALTGQKLNNHHPSKGNLQPIHHVSKSQVMGGNNKIFNNQSGMVFVEDQDVHIPEVEGEETYIHGEDRLRQKQKQVLENTQSKTIMTTQIKNIMHHQDKTLLTTSARLLSSRAIQKGEQQTQRSQNSQLQKPKQLSRPISTIELLKQMQQSKEEGDEEHQMDTGRVRNSGLPQMDRQNAMVTSASQPVLQQFDGTFPRIASSKKITLASEMKYNQQSINEPTSPYIHPALSDNLQKPGFMSQRKTLQRPSSTLLLSIGDNEIKNQLKKKLDLQGARNRDNKSLQKHSYLPKQSITSRWKNGGNKDKVSSNGGAVIAQPRVPPIPLRVSYQNALSKEGKNVSPFMLESQIQPTILIDKPLVNLVEEDLKRQEMAQNPPLYTNEEKIGMLRYSQSVEQLKTLQTSESIAQLTAMEQNQYDAEKKSVMVTPIVHKKGTSDFYRAKLKLKEKHTNQVHKPFHEEMRPISGRTMLTAQSVSDIHAYAQTSQGGTPFKKDYLKPEIFQNNEMVAPTTENVKDFLGPSERKFLPIEAFDPMIGVEDPSQCIENYRDPTSNLTLGMSKWNYPNGEAELRECIVENYINNDDAFLITWVHNRKLQKRVNRFNLIFAMEDKAMFQHRIESANENRLQAEVLIKYHYMLDKVRLTKPALAQSFISKQQTAASKKTSINEKPPVLEDDVKTRVSYLISTYHSYELAIKSRAIKNPLEFLMRNPEQRYHVKFVPRWQEFLDYENDEMVRMIHKDLQSKRFSLGLLQQLFKEIDTDFIHSHKKILFDLQLPYSPECMGLFSCILPPLNLIPVSERSPVGQEPKDMGLVQIPNRSLVCFAEKKDHMLAEQTLNFETLLLHITRRLSDAQPKKLATLQHVKVAGERFREMRFMGFNYETGPITKVDFQKMHLAAFSDLIQCVRDGLFDFEFEIQSMVNEKIDEIDRINKERKQSMTYNTQAFQSIPVPEEFLDEMRRYQRLIQLKVESTVREVFIVTLEEFQAQLGWVWGLILRSVKKRDPVIAMNQTTEISQPTKQKISVQRLSTAAPEKLEQQDPWSQFFSEDDINTLSNDSVLASRISQSKTLQFKLKMLYEKDTKELVVSPEAGTWIEHTANFVQKCLEEFTEINCFNVGRLGPVRKSGQFQIFLPQEKVGEPKRGVQQWTEGDTYVQDAMKLITGVMNKIFGIQKALVNAVSQFTYLLSMSMEKYAKEAQKQYKDKTLQEFSDELVSNETNRQHLLTLLHSKELKLGPFFVDVASVKKRMLEQLAKRDKIIEQNIRRKIKQVQETIENRVDEHLEIVQSEKFADIEEVTKVREFIANMEEKRMELFEMQLSINKHYSLLDKYKMYTEEKEMENYWSTVARPMHTQDEAGNTLQRLDKYSDIFMNALEEQHVTLLEMTREIQADFETVLEYSDLTSGHESAMRTCTNLHDKLEDALHESIIVNRRQGLYKQPLTDFSMIQKTQKEFAPHHRLWFLAREYFSHENLWMNGPVADEIMNNLPTQIDEACREIYRLQKTVFKDVPHTEPICTELRKHYESFRPFLPLIQALKNPNLFPRHFEEIRKLKDPAFDIHSDLQESISDLVKIGVHDIIDEISEVSDIATREKKLEEQIVKMLAEWKHLKFDVQDYKDSQTYMLVGIQPIWETLDEHIQKTILIESSPYVKYQIADVRSWKNTLIRMQDILEEWSKVQRGWMYLYPIFMSPDIQAQLPEVTEMFFVIDKNWRGLMDQTHQSPNILECCSQFGALENLQKSSQTIERVQKQLNAYLHDKQLLFSRFFFLSNDDLLHMLSQTKEPLRVQEHLNKCFEGIKSLNFETKNLLVKGMYSSHGEYIAFDKVVDPYGYEEPVQEDDKKKKKKKGEEDSPRPQLANQGGKVVRPLERWLTDVEAEMRMALRTHMGNCTTSFVTLKKADWIFAWPQQVILAIDQIAWTVEIEQAIEKQTQRTAQMACDKEQEKLKELVQLIRKPRGSGKDRLKNQMTLESLIVLNVHTKDETEEVLLKQKVDSHTDFEWIKVMRHYQEQVKDPKTNVLIFNLKLSMINSTRAYGFEYQGNTTRLVITPLTDRCYRTLMGALQLNLGGAPEGPAGTGKTETTKDLAKALAKHCLVFNCSDQLDMLTMTKFFMGLAIGGAWSCFDEFNRIELEVLSVIAEQILAIQNALQRRKANAPFEFDDQQIVMNENCAIFITMNPGYAGRSDLPDNLKALFRPVAMMVPNYATIAEIQLYSYGFEAARVLSVKIQQSLKLSSEQLSTQSHYDYGMRAVKTIILAAGALKRNHPDQDELELCLKAISTCNMPKFLNADIPLFSGIVSDLFPTTEKDETVEVTLQQAIDKSMMVLGLQPSDEFNLKTLQLHETITVRHGVMLVGQTMGGKSSVIKVLGKALELQSKENSGNDDFEAEKVVHVHSINPKSVTIGELYGDFEKLTKDWHDGILALAVREASADLDDFNLHWIHLDGPVDAVWIENMNTVLDDNKKLCLISGEIVKLTDQMRMMFEVEDLQEASPATVSRCGMVFTSPENLGWQVMTQSWIDELPEAFKQKGIERMYTENINMFVQSALDFIFGSEAAEDTMAEEKRVEFLRGPIDVKRNQVYRYFLNILESLLLEEETRETILDKELREREKKEAEMTRLNLRRSATMDRSGGHPETDRPTSPKAAPSKRAAQLTFIDVVEPVVINRIQQKFYMALIWGFGSHLDARGREIYSDFLHELMTKCLKIEDEVAKLSFRKRLDTGCMPAPKINLFSQFYNSKSHRWQMWTDDIGKYNIFGDKEDEVEKKVAAGDQTRNSMSSEPHDDYMDATAVAEIEEENQVEYSSIMIATEDSIQNQFIVDTLVLHSFPILLCGGTGTGKTRLLKKLVANLIKMGKWETGEMVLSATETAGNVLKYTQSKLDKHKRGVFGPKNPANKLMLFMDDMNMPAKEQWGAQPPLELLRQIISEKGCYNLKDKTWQKFVKLLFVTAMGKPGGARTLPTQRLTRHFNIMNVSELSRKNQQHIFRKILEWGFRDHPASWRSNIKSVSKFVIDSYLRTTMTLLPLPMKSHYLFNLRQVSEVIQGLLSVPADLVNKAQDSLSVLKKLCVHECQRVFADRLISEEDKQIFINSCMKLQPKDGKNDKSFINLDELGKSPSDLLFCTFVQFNPMFPVYQEVEDKDGLKRTLANIMQQYNAKAPNDQKMNLLLFDYMISHLSRVARIIAKPSGHGLLIGLGGNGRQSVTRLAAFVNDCTMQRIELHKQYGVNEWREDLRTLYKSLGIDNKKIVFSLADKDIKDEVFIEDVNSILNVGELTNLFAVEDIEEIQYEVQNQLKKKQKEDPMTVFTNRCKRNLHNMLFFSPAGKQLETYFQRYPSLVNCTTIDWFLTWPNEALLAVSKFYLDTNADLIETSIQGTTSSNEPVVVPEKQTLPAPTPGLPNNKMKLETIAETAFHRKRNSVMVSDVSEEDSATDSNRSFTESQKAAFERERQQEIDEEEEQKRIAEIPLQERIGQIMTQIHQSVLTLTEQYKIEKDKHVYVTPSLFQNLYSLMFHLLDRRTKEIDFERAKFEQGIQKLNDAKILVDDMQDQLTKLEPILDIKSKEVEQTMKRLRIEAKEVEKIKEGVDEEKMEVEKQKEIAMEIRDDCENELAKALPIYEDAMKALRQLKPADFVILKSMQNPPAGVRFALEGCCIMLEEKPKVIKIEGKKKDDYWQTSLKIMKKPSTFLLRLEKFDKDNLPSKIKQMIRPYINDPEFMPSKIKHASEAAEGVCRWVRALDEYDDIYKGIVPKREKAKDASDQLDKVQEQLQAKLDVLSELQAQQQKLQDEFNEQNSDKQKLVIEKEEAQKKLGRAAAIMGSIGSEKDRWIEMKIKLAAAKKSLLGDSILSTAFVTYLGAFEGHYRQNILREIWQPLVLQYQIQHTPTFNLPESLSNEEDIADWQLKGIPNDNQSIENMIILTETKDQKCPIFIDPQAQALKFMREFLSDSNFMTIKISEASALAQLEFCIQRGGIAVCENSGEVTHPALLAILKKELMSVQGDQYIKFNDKQIPYEKSFMLYVFSELSSPHFSPEVQQLASILNFTVTSEGLEQQLLSVVCKHESAKEEQERENLAKQNIKLNQQTRKIMNEILDTLRNSGSEILESDELVDKLEDSQKVTQDITQKLYIAQQIEQRIEDSRRIFKSVASHGARLYFAVQDLAVLDPMYKFSMKWFQELFLKPFEDRDSKEDEKELEKEDTNDNNQKKSQAPSASQAGDDDKSHQSDAMNKSFGSQHSSRDTPRRKSIMVSLRGLDGQQQTKDTKQQKVNLLKTDFREILFQTVSMSLFEKHKLLFAFFMAIRIYQQGEDSLATKLKELDRIGNITDLNSQLPSLVGSDAETGRKSRITGSQQRKSMASHSRRSDSVGEGNLQAQANLLAQQREEQRLKIDKNILQYMLTGMLPQNSRMYNETESPRTDVFNEEVWKKLCQLTSFEPFESLLEDIENNIENWERFMNAEGKNLFDLLPEPQQTNLPYFAWIALIRILKPEQTTNAIRRYIRRSLSEFFVTPIIHQLKDAFEESEPAKPILLILTPGNDPMEQIKKLASEQKKIPYYISLGKGQGEKAKTQIDATKKHGGWIILQNCHLSASFLPELEQIIENMQPKFKPATSQFDKDDDWDDDNSLMKNPQSKEIPPAANFRLWLTSMTMEGFPQTILQNSVKLTSEPPKGIKTSILRTFTNVMNVRTENDFFMANKKQEVWQPLFLALSFFHAIVRERRRFGPLGWNIHYDFNDSDFNVSKRQLSQMVEKFDQVPFQALLYLTGQCNYGGRVTEDKDVRVLQAILKDFYCEESMIKKADDKYYFASTDTRYYIYYGETVKETIEYVKGLPDEESPQLMGLHENANITQAIAESLDIFQNVLKLTAGDNAQAPQKDDDSSGASKRNGQSATTIQAKKIIADVKQMIRQPFKVKEVEKKFPFRYDESMNAVLVQELARFNSLVETVHSTLNTLDLTLDGQLVQTANSEAILQSVLNNIVPAVWRARSYPSRKTLLAYIADLAERLQMFDDWIEAGQAPNVYWISGFFFTQSFLTSVQQNFARETKVPIDKVAFRFEVLKPEQEQEIENVEASQGCFVRGLFLEGAGWNQDEAYLQESTHKQLYVNMPVIYFIAHEVEDDVADDESEQRRKIDHTYACPVYKTSQRSGTLTSTGHSTNFILSVDLDSPNELSSHWVKRSTALLCQLDN